jgi:hypothetical protein
MGEYGPSLIATAFIVSALGPASSARLIAAATISSRPSERCRGGDGGWVQIDGVGSAALLDMTVVYDIHSEYT